MHDRYVGRRSVDGGWKWDPPDPQGPKRPIDRFLIVLVAIAGIVTICLLIAGILLARGDPGDSATAGSSGNPSTPAPTSAPPGSALVWNQGSGEWQAGPLVLDEGGGTAATYLLNISGSTGDVHNVIISFSCGEGGRVQLVAGHNGGAAASDPARTSPGPGRPRLDSTALGGSIAVWGGTFAGQPTWEDGLDCAGQSLRLAVTARANPVSMIWSARLDPGSGEDDDQTLTTVAGVDGSPAGTLPVTFER